MIGVPPRVRVFFSMTAVDMRKQMDGLSIVVRESLGRDPRGGDMFVFRSRRGDMARILFYDGQGYCLLSKRFDKGVFQWPRTASDVTVAEMAARQLASFLMGTELVLGPSHRASDAVRT